MKPEIENLKMWMNGKSTTVHKRVLAIREFEQLLAYTSKIEQMHSDLNKEVERQIHIAKCDIKVCMDDFDREGEVNSDYPTEGYSKGEIYHKGTLLGLEKVLQIIKYAIEITSGSEPMWGSTLGRRPIKDIKD